MCDPSRWGMYKGSWQETGTFEFHGRIVDQEGKPLAGARISLELSKANPWFILGARSTFLNYPLQRTSDADGDFSIEGERGRLLVVRHIRDNGYTWDNEMESQRKRHYGGDTVASSYGPPQTMAARHQATKDNPAVFKLIKNPD